METHTGLGFAGAGTPTAAGGGYVYLRNRWYDPQTGRFLSQDPIGLAGGVNLYAYAGNNPISYSDPFGTCPPEWMCQLIANFVVEHPQAAEAVSSLIDQETAGFACGSQGFYNCTVPPSGTAGALLGQVSLALGTARMPMASAVGEGVGGVAAADASLGSRIAGGHAIKHLGEFESLGIKSEAQLAQHVDNVVANAAGGNVRALARGRTAYYSETSNTVVIKNLGATDGGTVFRPRNGRAYFDGLQ